MDCPLAEAVGLLEGHPPFAPLRLRTLARVTEAATVALQPALPPALSRTLAEGCVQPSLASLILHQMDMRAPGALDSLVDAVVARPQVTSLGLAGALSPAAVPSLARALRDGALRVLLLAGVTLPFLDAAGGTALGDAVRASGVFNSLTLLALPPLEAAAVAALLGALAGHPSLRALSLNRTPLEEPAAALTALLVADAPALKKLELRECGLGEEGLGALLDALPRNSHLRELDIRDNDVPAGFMRARLIPAVRGNASLRKLLVGNDNADAEEKRAMAEAQRILAAR